MKARNAGKKDAVEHAVIHTEVHLGEPNAIGGFGLAVDIKVEGVDDDALIQAAHEVCFVFVPLPINRKSFIPNKIVSIELPLQPRIKAWGGRQRVENLKVEPLQLGFKEIGT